jgi:hypothetical protein
MPDSTITLIGFGISGQILLSYILTILAAHNITIIDPDFVGGDLAREYGAIQSNTTIETKVRSIESLVSMTGTITNWSNTISSLKGKGSSDSTVNLSDLASDIRITGIEMANKVKCIYDIVSAATWVPEENLWHLTLGNGKTHTTQVVCFCTGMLPKKEVNQAPKIKKDLFSQPLKDLPEEIIPVKEEVVEILKTDGFVFPSV